MPSAQAAMPFIVLSDSTLQYLLWMDGSGKSYGVETVDQDPLRQAVICPGASLVMPRDGTVRTPPVLEVLAWHLIRVLGREHPFPTDHQPLTDLLKKYYYTDTYVRLIPLRESLNPNKQGAYDWLADVRDQYGLSADDLSDQTIMSLQGNDPDLVEQLYSSKDCHFRPSIALKAIGLLLGRARTEMMRSRPLAQKQQCQERGLGPTQEGKLPTEFLLMAIGIKKDHIFQGIIYGQPQHPLFTRAIAHAFSISSPGLQTSST